MCLPSRPGLDGWGVVVVPGDGLLPVTESSSLKAGLRVDRVGVAGAGRDNLTYELLP